DQRTHAPLFSKVHPRPLSSLRDADSVIGAASRPRYVTAPTPGRTGEIADTCCPIMWTLSTSNLRLSAGSGLLLQPPDPAVRRQRRRIPAPAVGRRRTAPGG